jgi:hypothetical protein
MITLTFGQSTPGRYPNPEPAPMLILAGLASLTFTIMLVQAHASAGNGARGLLPVLVAGLLGLGGMVTCGRPES